MAESSEKGNDLSVDDKKSDDELTTKEAYFASLKEWVHHANISQNAIAMFPWYLLTMYPQVFQPQIQTTVWSGSSIPTAATTAAMSSRTNSGNQQQSTTTTNNNIRGTNTETDGTPSMNSPGYGIHIMNEQAQAEFIARNGGYEYILAPFWKRAIAEFIDIVLFLLLKIGFVCLVMTVFNLKLVFDIDKDVFRKAMENNDHLSFLLYSIDLVIFSSDLLLLELITKIMVCVHEAIWVAKFNGSTPGKAIMGLTIKYVEAVYTLPPNVAIPRPLPLLLPLALSRVLAMQGSRIRLHALMYPAETPNMMRALLRAVVKNMILSLLFPMCFLMVLMKNNRTVYDIITKTVVVEKPSTNQPLTLRRDFQ